jgi:hypothetical protein
MDGYDAVLMYCVVVYGVNELTIFVASTQLYCHASYDKCRQAIEAG